MNMLVSTAAISATAAPIAASEQDPIFAAIARVEAAKAECDAVSAEIRRLHALADEKVGRPSVTIVNPETGLPEEISCRGDLHRLGLSEADHEQAWEDLNAKWSRWNAIVGCDEDEMIAGPADEEQDAAEEFAATVPTTVAGLLAMIQFAAVLAGPGYNLGPSDPAELNPIDAMAEAARNLEKVLIRAA